MIYRLKRIEDRLVQEAYDEGMKSLNDFWGIGWTKGTPKIYVVDSRADIDEIKGFVTEPWLVGWATGLEPGDRKIYVLDFDKFESESNHDRNEEKYKMLIKHELCHLFMSTVSNGSFIQAPMWLNEGVSVYLSGQIYTRKKPDRFVGFLDSDRKNPFPAYGEGSFVVELLVNKFGKEKLISLVKKLPELKERRTLFDIFEEVYGFVLSYDNINDLYISK